MTLHTREMAQTVEGKGSDRPVADQARPLAFAGVLPLVFCLALPLGACSVPGQINPRALGRDMSGAALDARGPIPGSDRPTPNLASVPPIPERPDPAARAALTRQLEAERDASTTEVPVARAADPLNEPAAPGRPPIPARPPAPAALASAPVIPWTAPRPAQPAPAAGAPVARPPELLTPERLAPGAVPALPTPDLLTPAPAAQPRAPSVEQLAPSEVPALPSPELLAPATPR